MRSNLLLVAAWCLFSGSSVSQAADTEEIWESCFASDKAERDQKIGDTHLILEKTELGGKSITRATRELRITIKRDGQLAQLKADTGTEETEEGQVVGVFMRHWLGEKQALTMVGKLGPNGKEMRLNVTTNIKKESTIPWDPKVIGLARELTFLKEKMAKPGDAFSYRYYEPSVAALVNIRVDVLKEEEILLPRGGKRKLLRVESTPEKIEDVQLPSSVIWIDPKTREVVTTQIAMPDFGLLTLQRATKAVATGPLGEIPDLMRQQTLRLKQRLPGDVHALNGIVYRITYKGDNEPAKLVGQDDR